MMEIRKVGADGERASRLFINGRQLDAEVEMENFPSETVCFKASDPEIVALFLTRAFSELSSISGRIQLSDFPVPLKLWEGISTAQTVTILRKEEDVPAHLRYARDFYDRGQHKNEYQLEFHVYGTAAEWRYPWTITEYRREFQAILKAMNISQLTWEEQNESSDLIDIIPSIKVTAAVTNDDTQIGAEIAIYIDIFNRVHEQAVNNVSANIRADSLVMYFDFPQEVEVYCEQYLLYFVQFLKDLGVEATAELKHEAGQVLFAVTPADQKDALNKLCVALELYLKLPSSHAIDAISIDHEVAVQRLVATIDHLKSQLRLAQAILQAKDATIQAQEFTIRQQQGLLSGEIIAESMKDVKPKPDKNDREEVLGGIVEITKYEGKGINVNLAEVFRRLRRLFSEEKE